MIHRGMYGYGLVARRWKGRELEFHMQAKERRGRSGNERSWDEIWRKKRVEEGKGKIFNRNRKIPKLEEKRLEEEKGGKRERKKVEEKEGSLGSWKEEMEDMMREVTKMGLRKEGMEGGVK